LGGGKGRTAVSSGKPRKGGGMEIHIVTRIGEVSMETEWDENSWEIMKKILKRRSSERGHHAD